VSGVLDQASKTRTERIPGGLSGTHVSAARVVETIKRTEQLPVVFSMASDIARRIPSLDSQGRRNHEAEARAIYRFVERAIRYTDHPLYANAVFIEPQFIIDRWEREGLPVAADCIYQTMLVAVLARNMGIPARARVIGESPRDFYHIHPELFINGEWKAADVTAATATDRKIREAAQLGFRPGAGLEVIYDID